MVLSEHLEHVSVVSKYLVIVPFLFFLNSTLISYIYDGIFLHPTRILL